MARTVAEMYRIENVIYIRVRAVGELEPGPTAKLLHYRRRAYLAGPTAADGVHPQRASIPPDPTLG